MSARFAFRDFDVQSAGSFPGYPAAKLLLIRQRNTCGSRCFPCAANARKRLRFVAPDLRFGQRIDSTRFYDHARCYSLTIAQKPNMRPVSRAKPGAWKCASGGPNRSPTGVWPMPQAMFAAPKPVAITVGATRLTIERRLVRARHGDIADRWWAENCAASVMLASGSDNRFAIDIVPNGCFVHEVDRQFHFATGEQYTRFKGLSTLFIK